MSVDLCRICPAHGSVIRTSIPGTTLFHFGVAFYQRPWLTVAHNAKGQGVRVVEIEQFSGDRVFEVLDWPDPRTGDLRFRRALGLVGRPYDLASFNCEHFVNLVCSGTPSSPQLQSAAFGVLLGGVLLLALAA